MTRSYPTDPYAAFLRGYTDRTPLGTDISNYDVDMFTLDDAPPVERAAIDDQACAICGYQPDPGFTLCPRCIDQQRKEYEEERRFH